ncbi:hypothetical protein ACFV4J_12725 [Streptomyces mirabilis]|uniref:hypothetical protein n=1 Tax=Streptomyces mirabilis TaxID=68239 RepID=UPI00364DBA2B
MAGRPWREDLRAVHLPFHRRLLPHLGRLAPLWTHNDRHASNLLWNPATGTVSTVLDGLRLLDRVRLRTRRS